MQFLVSVLIVVVEAFMNPIQAPLSPHKVPSLHSPLLSLLSFHLAPEHQLASVLMYVAILPEEYDASFKKALTLLPMLPRRSVF